MPPDPALTPALVIATSPGRSSAIATALAAVGWQTEVCLEPREALERLKGKPYSAIFCDELLRGASAAGFLAWSKRVAPEAPFYVVGAEAEAAQTRYKAASGVLAYPLVNSRLPHPTRAAATLPDPLTKGPRAGVAASLTGNTALVPLSDMLEMMGLAQQSALVELGLGGSRGRVFVDKGTLVHADTHEGGSPLLGLSALAQLIVLEACDFKLLPYLTPGRPTIGLPVTAALTEAARLADEQRRYQTLLDTLRSTCPEVSAALAGYLLASSPSRSYGETAELFRQTKALLDNTRTTLGGRADELVVVEGERVIVVQRFGEDNLLAACGPRHIGAALYSAVQTATARHA